LIIILLDTSSSSHFLILQTATEAVIALFSEVPAADLPFVFPAKDGSPRIRHL
jgi:hypothetical protein